MANFANLNVAIASRYGSEADLLATDEFYMREALALARQAADLGEVPIGAVVVYDPVCKATRKPARTQPEIIARAFNLREKTRDPSAHAEFSAMLRAAYFLNTWRLSGCCVYVTLEPCVMCAGLMQQARIDRCVFGAFDAKGGALGSLYRVNEDVRLNHNFSVSGGVLRDECAALLSDFFRARRGK